MSHREGCMIGDAFSSLLVHLGILKHPPSKPSPSSPAASSSSCSSSSSPSDHRHPHHQHLLRAEEPRSQNLPALRPSRRESSFDDGIRMPGIPQESFFAGKVPPAAASNEAAGPGKVPLIHGFRVRVSSSSAAAPLASKGIIPSAPVVCECTPGSGGVQGLQWYSENLMMDEDGDIAQEFLDEVVSHTLSPLRRSHRNFKIIVETIPAKLEGPVCTSDGNVVQCMGSDVQSASHSSTSR